MRWGIKVVPGVLALMVLLGAFSEKSNVHGPSSVTRTSGATSPPTERPVVHDTVEGSAAAIYAAVIRQLVVTDRSGDRANRVVYVVDGAVPSAGDPLASTTDPVQRFDAALKLSGLYALRLGICHG